MKLRGLALLLVILLAGCTRPTPTAPPASAPPVASTPPAAAVAVPKESEICLKPEGGPALQFTLARAQSDGGYSAGPGWLIPWGGSQVLGSVVFPQPIDRESVKLSVSSPDWVYVKPTWPDDRENAVRFAIMPKEAAQADPLVYVTGKPGWLTLFVESASSKEGTPLLEAPVALRIFMYDNALGRDYPYLDDCLATMSMKPGIH